MTYLRAHPNTIGITLACALGVLVASRDPVWLDTAILIGIYALIALSAGISFGQAGILSMAQGAFAAIGGYAAAISALKLGLPAPLGLVLALAIPAALAYGLARILIRLAPLATALATLSLGSIIEILVRNWDAVTGGYIGLAGIPPIAAIDSPVKYLLLVSGMTCLTVFVYENLMRSAYGRAVNVIRHDRSRAKADGIPVIRLLSAIFALSAAVAGSAGWAYAHYVSYLGPSSLDTDTSIAALLMAVIGGSRYVLGPVAGTAIFQVIQLFLPAQEVEGLFYGGTLIVILLVARDGMFGLVAQACRRVQRPRRAAPASVDQRSDTPV